MTERQADARSAPREGQPTRGFLFTDLRGYTAFLERNGAAAAADVLARYRGLVRDAIDQFRGAEVRTEGDSFYVVFPSVSAAVECGVAIADVVERDIAASTEPAVGVGIGVHAGETIETAEGYVGTAVNVAARLCALARPGEVLVSDTVRGLTRNVLAVPFVPRGHRQLKGIAEPVAIYAVRGGPLRPRARAGLRARSMLPAVAAVLVLVIAIGAVAGIALLTGRDPAGAVNPTATPSAAAQGTVASARPSASPSAAALTARELQLLEHVPPLYRQSCRSGPGVAGRAQLVCTIPDIGLVTYTQFDSADAMRADYERRWQPRATPVPLARRCREEPYERPYVGASGAQRGRYVCWEEPFGASVAWTDENLSIIGVVTAPYFDLAYTLDLYALAEWWEEGLAGPVP